MPKKIKKKKHIILVFWGLFFDRSTFPQNDHCPGTTKQIDYHHLSVAQQACSGVNADYTGNYDLYCSLFAKKMIRDCKRSKVWKHVNETWQEIIVMFSGALGVWWEYDPDCFHKNHPFIRRVAHPIDLATGNLGVLTYDVTCRHPDVLEIEESTREQKWKALNTIIHCIH